MDSLALPEELYWGGKTEPTSPPSNDIFSISDPIENWPLFDNNFANELYINSEHLYEIKTSKDFYQELVNGDDLVIELSSLKKEHWIDSKLDSVPQHLDYSIDDIIPTSSAITKVQIPEEISSLGSSTLTQLTPPQSPPHTIVPVQVVSQNGFKVNDIIANHHAPSDSTTDSRSSMSTANFGHYTWSGNNTVAVASKCIDEIERETKIVDEIVNTRALELIDWNEDSHSMFSLSTPSLLSITDEECLANSPSMTSSFSSSPGYVFDGDFENTSIALNSIPKKRTRPYGRGVEDRKMRKKEQNKNAATRYRQKKKQEMEDVLSEEQKFTNRNEELKRILADRNREAQYLKTLIREFYKKNKS